MAQYRCLQCLFNGRVSSSMEHSLYIFTQQDDAFLPSLHRRTTPSGFIIISTSVIHYSSPVHQKNNAHEWFFMFGNKKKSLTIVVDWAHFCTNAAWQGFWSHELNDPASYTTDPVYLNEWASFIHNWPSLPTNLPVNRQPIFAMNARQISWFYWLSTYIDLMEHTSLW